MYTRYLSNFTAIFNWSILGWEDSKLLGVTQEQSKGQRVNDLISTNTKRDMKRKQGQTK